MAVRMADSMVDRMAYLWVGRRVGMTVERKEENKVES